MSAPQRSSPHTPHPSPFIEINRADWAALTPTMESPLREEELEQLRGLGELLDEFKVAEVFLPLSRLLNLYAPSTQRHHGVTSDFLREPSESTPFVIGVAGSVAVGKSTISRLLRELLSRWEGTPRVELVTTDGFLYSNGELERRGLMMRKGFPESYDRRALLRFVSDIKSGAASVSAPCYSHLEYDIVPGTQTEVHRPDVLIIEGLNVLQPAVPGTHLAVSDLFDFTIYVDARTRDIAHWYEERFLRLQRGAFTHPRSYFHRYATLSEQEARAQARELWQGINEPNLVHNILPTRSRASLVLRKGTNHAVSHVLLSTLSHSGMSGPRPRQSPHH